MRYDLGQKYGRSVIIPMHSIFTQLILFTVIVSIVPIVFISALLIQKISNMATGELVNSQSQIVFQYISEKKDRLLQYEDSLNHIANNTVVLNTLTDKTGDRNPYIKGKDVSIEVNKSLRLKRNTEVRNCIIYSNARNSKLYGSRVTMVDESGNEKWYSGIGKFDRDYFINKSLNGENYILSLIKNIIYIDTSTFESENVGFIKLDIHMDQLFAPAMNPSVENYPYDVIVLDNLDHIVYSSNTSYNDIFKKLPFEKLQKKEIIYYKNEIVFGDSIDDYGLKFIFLFNNSQLSAKRLQITGTFLPVIFLIICIIVTAAYVFTRKFSMRVDKLVNKIKVAETGDLTMTGEIGGNDEIAVLDKQFNRMLLKLDDLINKNYIQRLEKKETELRNLQLQINPHFLYNTLEVISAIAAEKQLFSVCELCEKLGSIFRYSLGRNFGEYVTVTQELQHTQNYLYIQQTRSGNKFDVFYNIAPELKEMLIPRFILQPIIENAVAHGLRNMASKGALGITVACENHRLAIKIEDDGIGMSQEKVEELNQYINSDSKDRHEDKKGVGIRNVNQRIKLICGNEYGITIDSVEGQGSCFTIWLPLNKKWRVSNES